MVNNRRLSLPPPFLKNKIMGSKREFEFNYKHGEVDETTWICADTLLDALFHFASTRQNITEIYSVK